MLLVNKTSIEVVAVQVQLCGIHGDEDGNIGVIGIGTFDNIPRPGGVMLACASTWALHATITGEIVATSAQVETMGRIGTEKGPGWDLRHQTNFSSHF